MLTIHISDDRVELADDAARELADELWKGSVPGAVTAATKLGKALARKAVAQRVVHVETTEARAVRSALDALQKRAQRQGD
jgi:uncharacterized protein YbjQ (UPF0145 family)